MKPKQQAPARRGGQPIESAARGRASGSKFAATAAHSGGQSRLQLGDLGSIEWGMGAAFRIAKWAETSDAKTISSTCA
jgi:hypothetical protein